ESHLPVGANFDRVVGGISDAARATSDVEQEDRMVLDRQIAAVDEERRAVRGEAIAPDRIFRVGAVEPDRGGSARCKKANPRDGGQRGAGQEGQRFAVRRCGDGTDVASADCQGRDGAVVEHQIKLSLEHKGQPALAQPGQLGNALGLAAGATVTQMGEATTHPRVAIPDPDIAKRMPSVIPQECQALAVRRP
uniref:ABC transporter ATP-binding protein n=1 Tax=Parastrongyloides trichosuri TaxID=131310 RepID=A0A0N4Z8C1_PARTI